MVLVKHVEIDIRPTVDRKKNKQYKKCLCDVLNINRNPKEISSFTMEGFQ